MMCACTIAALSFIMLSTFKGIPISTTHTDSGALIGSGLAGVGVYGIGWGRLIKVVLSWFVSPVVSMTISAVLFYVVCATTLGGYFTLLRHKVASVYIISALTFAQVTFMLINIATNKKPDPRFYILIPISTIIGVIMTKYVLV